MMLSSQFIVLNQGIFELAIQDIKRRLNSKSKVTRLRELDFTWNWQVFQFLKIQLKNHKLEQCQEQLQGRVVRTIMNQNLHCPTRKEMALRVAAGGGWGRTVAERILRHENMWMKQGMIPAAHQGKHAKIASWLDDKGVLIAVRQDISEEGERKACINLTY